MRTRGSWAKLALLTVWLATAPAALWPQQTPGEPLAEAVAFSPSALAAKASASTQAESRASRQAPPRHSPCTRNPRFEVTIAPALGAGPYSGRLLVLLSARTSIHGFLAPGFGAETRQTWIAAREIDGVMPGESVGVDSGETAFPAAFSAAPPGDYYVMAMLDVNHSANFEIFSPGTLRMKAVLLKSFEPCTAAAVHLTLDLRVATEKAEVLPTGMEWIDFISPALSRFYGRPIAMRGMVVLPPSAVETREKREQQAANQRSPVALKRFPTVYLIPGFGATVRDLRRYFGDRIREDMADGSSPEMIYVLLDVSLPTGAHEFADSVNNGPWGEALVRELIPYLESRYPMQATPAGRFLTGHSSGGWSSLWLQITYPEFFGGAWSTSPDPVDFRSFTGPDIADAKPGSNFYMKANGKPWMLVRMDGKEAESLRDYAQQEQALGEYGGQMASFEWVFSPRGADGRPMQLFDRATGAINLAVAAAWEKYDIARILRENWGTLGPKLKGKIHVFVGTEDSFHLEPSVRLLEKELKRLGSDAEFTYLQGRNHFDLYCCGLGRQIAKEMWARAAGSQ